jgi:hypothetical protein
MLTGVLIGPGALRLVSDPHHVAVLAEVGVTMLLFMIGLEFSLARLKEIGRAFLVAGPLQVLGTMAIATLAFSGLLANDTLGRGLPRGRPLSSTIHERLIYVGRRGPRAGPPRLNILLFQGFAMVPMLVWCPPGGFSASPSAPGSPPPPGAAAVWIAGTSCHGGRRRDRSGVRELYVMAIAVCLGAALVTRSSTSPRSARSGRPPRERIRPPES